MTAQEAVELAVRLANEEAKRLYEVTPFHVHAEDVSLSSNRWVWQSLAGAGKVDLLGTVRFDRDGTNSEVHLEMFSSIVEPMLRLPGESVPFHRLRLPADLPPPR